VLKGTKLNDGDKCTGQIQPANERLVDAILDLEFPLRQLTVALATGLKTFADKGAPSVPTEPEKARQRKAILMTLPEADLRNIQAALLAERARKAEAAQFYNAQHAKANYDYWLSMDFWTLDDSIALLLGRCPKVVTWDAVNQALRPQKRFFAPAPSNTPFLRLYDSLREAALRTEIMMDSPRLKPLDVAKWGKKMLGKKLPLRLQAILDAEAPLTVLAPPPTQTEKPARECSSIGQSSNGRTKVKKAALKALAHLWPTVEADLNHAGRTDLAEVAKAPEHGMWYEESALDWARRNGRLKGPATNSSLSNLPSRIFKIEDR
jgi:hypothetical protein